MLQSSSPNMAIPQDIQDEIESLVVLASLTDYDISRTIHYNPTSPNFSEIHYVFIKEKIFWRLILAYTMRGEKLNSTIFKKSRSNTYISSTDLDDNLLAPIKLAKMMI